MDVTCIYAVFVVPCKWLFASYNNVISVIMELN